MAAKGIELASGYVALTADPRELEKSINAGIAAAVDRVTGKPIGTKLANDVRNALAGNSGIADALTDSTRGAGTRAAASFVRDVNGRIRDERGRFIKASRDIGDSLAAGVATSGATAAAGFVRDINGRLRDQHGRFVKLGAETGDAVGQGVRKGAAGAGSEFSRMFSRIEQDGKRAAAKTGSAVANTLKTAIRGAVSATGVGLGITGGLAVGDVLLSGLDRLKVIQSAQVQLSTMHKSAEQIKSIVADVNDVVTGTSVTLSEAMNVVPQALGAGVKEGAELRKYIKDIADATASTGGQRSFQDVSVIFGQILGKGKLQLEELNQLEEGGVHVRNILMEAFHWDQKEFNRQLSKGKIGMSEIQTAIEKTFGAGEGLAKKTGQTFDGAVSNMKASVARLGANFISAIFGTTNTDDPLKGATDGVNKLTTQLKSMETWVMAHEDDIHGFFEHVGDAANFLGDALGKIKEGWDWLSSHMKDPPEWVKWWFGDKAFSWPGSGSPSMGSVGMPTANAASDTTAFNPGPMAPGAQPLGVVARRIGDNTGLKAGTIALKDRIATLFPQINDIGGYRPPDHTAYGNFDEHASGEALDVMIPKDLIDKATGKANAAGIALGNQIVQEALRDGADYAIWQQQEWGPDGSTTKYPDRGSPTDNHFDHVHIRQKQHPTVLQQFGGPGKLQAKAGPQEQLPFGTPKGGVGGPQAAVRQAMLDAGFPADSWDKLDYIIQHESNYNVNATNPATGDWGIPQFNPAAGNIERYIPDRSTDPYRQGSAMMQYIKDRYGSIEAAYDFKKANGWYATGGGVSGPGTATSDSIPAWLSTGEHVLTAADVKAMGGQNGVYAFRNALHRAGGGAIPGFEGGGDVDPNAVRDAQNNLADLNNQVQVNQAQLNEIMNSDTPDPTSILQAQQQFEQSQRALMQAQEALPFIASGGTPPDHGPLNRVYSADDAAKLAQAQLDALKGQDDVPVSQMMQAQYAADAANRERDQARADFTTGQQQKPPSLMDELLRTKGFMPANAGNTGVAGTSSLAGFLNLGNEAVGGLIDTGASLAQMAVSGAVAAGTMGAGAAAAPAAGAAAGYGIQLGATELKRGVAYGFQMLSILADAGVEQLNPFGAPRWLGYDYTGFAPHLGIQQALLTTAEKAGAQAIGNHFKPGGGDQLPAASSPAAPVQPNQLPGASGNADVQAPPGAGPLSSAAGTGSIGTGPVPDSPKQFTDPYGTNGGNQALAAPVPGSFSDQYNKFLSGAFANGGAIFDTGGVLEPKQLAMNMSKRPEYVFTQKQLADMKGNASIPPEGQPLVGTLITSDQEEAFRKLAQIQRRNMMQYSGRP